MKIEQVHGVSERQIEAEPYDYVAVIGPKKPWWVDYLPDPFTLPMYDLGSCTSTEVPSEPSKDEDLDLSPAADDSASAITRVINEKEASTTSLLFVFRDGLDQPIKGMEVKIGSDDSATPQRTDERGTIQITPPAKTGNLQVTVKDHDGREQKVCDIDLARCRREIKVQSTKVVVSVRSRPHHVPSLRGGGISSSSPPSVENHLWYEVNGALEKSKSWLASLLHSETTPIDRAGISEQPHVITETATKAGHPTTVVVGPEIDRVHNLRLGEDNIYRDIILRAAQRAKIVPHAICGLLACEAVRRCEKVYEKDKNGKIRHDKKGNPIVHVVPHEWDARSYNDDWMDKSGKVHRGTHAAGLTQFLPLSWLDCILKPGYFISDESLNQKKAWIAVDKGVRVFVLSDGRTVKRNELLQFYGRNKAEQNVAACLEMRFEPEWSIMTAVDYATENLKGLSFKEGISGLDSLTHGEKAKIMYLLHHEGPGDGPKFIRNVLVVEQQKFSQNMSSPEKWLRLARNDRSQAYRLCLADYIDSRIDFCRFSYYLKSVEKVPPLLDICQKIAK